ncbi:MAG: glycosyltransferase family 2 protein, partial [Planctomycetota bacterium]
MSSTADAHVLGYAGAAPVAPVAGVYPRDAGLDNDTPPELSVVVPCYNETECVEQFHERTVAACEARGHRFEIVYINDGSKDDTLAKLTTLAHADPHGRVVVVNLSRNHGHQLALTAGLTVARGQRILVLDADLQDPPELLGPMWDKMDAEQLDVVYGQRKKRDGETVFKLFTAAMFYRVISRMSETDIPQDTGDFRLMSRRALDALLAMGEHHRFVRGMVSWVGFRQAAYQYDRDSRFAGDTKYPITKMVRFAVDAITSFSVKPLRFG